MTVKAGMLPGDEFSFEEWKAAQGKPVSTPEVLPRSIELACEELGELCKQFGIPMVTVFGLKGGENVSYNLLDKPENVSHALLLARSAGFKDMTHNLSLMAYSLQGMDLSKLKL